MTTPSDPTAKKQDDTSPEAELLVVGAFALGMLAGVALATPETRASLKASLRRALQRTLEPTKRRRAA